MKKKILLMLVLGTIFLAGAGVIAWTVLPNGDIIIEQNELAQITNQQIANYMINQFDISRHYVADDKIIVYYNIVYLEPLHMNGSYRVFTQEKPFIIKETVWDFCMNLTNDKQNVCVEYLVHKETITQYNITSGNETETLEIKSTKYKAMQEQIRQYHRAVEFRDKAIYNQLEGIL